MKVIHKDMQVNESRFFICKFKFVCKKYKQGKTDYGHLNHGNCYLRIQIKAGSLWSH